MTLENKLVEVETEGTQWKQNYYTIKKIKEKLEKENADLKASVSGWKLTVEELKQKLTIEKNKRNEKSDDLQKKLDDSKYNYNDLEVETDDEIFKLEGQVTSQIIKIRDLEKTNAYIENEYGSFLCVLTEEFFKGNVKVPKWIACYMARNTKLEVNRP
jgi:DNA-binding transcriptional MerR regulator